MPFLKYLRVSITIVFLSLIFFLFFDFLFGKLLLEKTNLLTNNQIFKEKRIRVVHPIYHHTLASNINFKSKWGQDEFFLCTNADGFRIDCKNQNQENQIYDIAIIGDSFVEGLGINYEKTLSGILEKELNKKIINLGVSSYSTSIYLEKIKFHLENGLKFHHLILFPDISDLHDETNLYINSNGRILDKKLDKRLEYFTKLYFPLSNSIIFLLKNLSSNKIDQTFSHKIIRSNNPSYSLYHNTKVEWVLNQSNNLNNYDLPKDQAIKNMLRLTDELVDFLKKKNIKLSVVVYPWPQVILNNTKENIYLETWKNFCKNNCHNFIDSNQIFLNEANKIGKIETVKKYYIYSNIWWDVHFNEAGQKIIANNILNKFKF